jgi:hypothetical protein
MLHAQSPRLFDVPFPSLVLVLAPAHAYPDRREYVLGKESTDVFDHRKVVCTLECFSLRMSGAEENLTAVYMPVHSSRKSGRLTSLVAEYALACFSSTRRMDKLQ